MTSVKNIAFIPARGGSKSIPFKNIKELNGRPMIYWSIRAACRCININSVFVATDSERIKNVLFDIKKNDGETFSKLVVIGRSAGSATDTASTESAMLEFAQGHDFDNIVLIQATSPLLSEDDLNRGFDAYLAPDVDSVLSVVRQRRFFWATDNIGMVSPINYDIFARPRRQDFDGMLVENGAFYITSRERLLSTKNRISGKIKAVEMHEDTYFEVDEEEDWQIIEALMRKRGIFADDVPEIKMLLTDCDGCLTDGGMYYSEYGDELKKFNTRDGVAFEMLRARGIITGIITGEDVELNRRRADKLKVDIYISNCKDKLAVLNMICEDRGVDLKNVAYIGDDLNDLAVMNVVGLSCCPQDACSEIKKVAKYIAAAKGGEGVVREVVEYLINNTWKGTQI